VVTILSTHLRLGLPTGLFPSGFPTKYLTRVPLLPHLCYMPCLSHRPWLDHSNYTWRRVHVMKVLITSPATAKINNAWSYASTFPCVIKKRSIGTTYTFTDSLSLSLYCAREFKILLWNSLSAHSHAANEWVPELRHDTKQQPAATASLCRVHTSLYKLLGRCH
jgi:hypothetical protein